MLGIIQFTRPLPDAAPEEMREAMAWLLDVYLRGLGR